MNSLARTIDQTLDNIGAGPRDLLIETLSAFEALGLVDEERLAAIATAIATSGKLHHLGHETKFLDAVQIWSLEAVEGQSPALPRIDVRPQPERIIDAADIISHGLDALLEALSDAQVTMQHRVVSELTLFTRLLSRHDVPTILKTIGVISETLSFSAYRAGDLVTVPLRDLPLLDRSADLMILPVQGRA